MATLGSYLTDEIDAQTGRPTGRQFELPLYAPPAQEQPRNPFIAGLSSGIDQFQGLGGSLLSLAGTLVGSDTLREAGDAYAAQQRAEAAANGRPDIVAPWREGGKGWSGVPEWLAYNVAQTLPETAATMAAAAIGAPLVAGTAATAGAARLFGAVPQFLGGARGLGTKAATDLAESVVGGALVGAPAGAGRMFGEAQERAAAGGDPVDRVDALKALAFAPFYQGLETIGPANLLSTYLKSEGRSRLGAAALGGLKGGVSEAFTEPAQTSLELSFRPDMTIGQKADAIVDSFITGGAVGTILGGAAGAARRAPRLDPSTPPENLGAAVDQMLALPPPQPLYVTPGGRVGAEPADLRSFEAGQRFAAEQQARAQAEAPGVLGLPEPTMFVGPEGRAARSLQEMAPGAAAVDPEVTPAGQRYAAEQFARARAEAEAPIPLPEPTMYASPSGGTARTLNETANRPYGGREEGELRNGLEVARRVGRKDVADAIQEELAIRDKLFVDDLFKQSRVPTGQGARNKLASITDRESALAYATSQLENIENGSAPRYVESLARNLGLIDARGVTEAGEAARAPAPAPRAPDTVLDARAAVPLRDAVVSGQATPEQRQRFGQMASDLARQGQQVPEAVGPTQPAPYVQNISEGPDGQMVQRDLAGPEQRAPTPAALVPPVGPDVAALRQRFDAGERLNSTEMNRLAAQLVRDQRGTSTQEALPLPPNREEFQAQVKNQLAADLKLPQLRRLGLPETVADDASFDRYVLDRRAAAANPETAPQWIDAVARARGLISPKGNLTAKGRAAKGGTSAVPKQSAKRVDVRQSAQAGRQVPGRNTQGNAAPVASQQPVQGQVSAPIQEQGSPPVQASVPVQGQGSTSQVQGARNADAAQGQQPNVTPTAPPAPKVTAAPRRNTPALSRGEARAMRPALTKLADSLTDAQLAKLSERYETPTTKDDVKEMVQTSDPREMIRDLAAALGTTAPKLQARIMPKGAKARLDEADETARTTGNGYTREQAEAIIEPVLRNIPGLPNIVVMDTRQAPETATEQTFLDIEQQSGPTRALYDTRGGEPVITIAANRHASPEQVLASLYHELLGHFGLQRAYGERLTSTLRDIYNTSPRIREAVDTGKYQDYTLEDRVEEYLVAQLEGGRVQASIMDKLVNFVRSIGRRLGIFKGEYSQREIAVILDRASSAVLDNQGAAVEATGRAPMQRRSVADTMQDVKKAMAQIRQSAPRRSDIREGLVAQTLKARSLNDIVIAYNDLFKSGGLRQYKQAIDEGNGLTNRFGAISVRGMDRYTNASETHKKLINEKIIPATMFRIDPSKKLEDNKHAFSDDPKQQAEVERIHKEGHDAYNRLKREGGLRAYEDFVAGQEVRSYGLIAQALYSAVQSSPSIAQDFKEQLVSPTSVYKTQRGVSTEVTAARNFFKAQVERLMAEIDKHQKEKGTQNATQSDSVSSAMNLARQQIAAMKQAPFFHSPRFGDNIVSFKFKLDGGRVTQDTLDKVADRLNQLGITDVDLTGDKRRPNAFMRFESKKQADAVFAMVKDLEQQGLIENARGFLRTDPSSEVITENTVLVDRLLQEARASFFTDAELAKMPDDQAKQIRLLQEGVEDNIRRAYLDLLPDTSLTKLMSKRQNVFGASRDIQRGYAHHAGMVARSLGNQYADTMSRDALTNMRKDVKDMSASDPAKARAGQEILNELTQRRAERPIVQKDTWLDYVRAFNHSWFLALNPAYWVSQITQLGVFGVPELAKDAGYVKSMQAVKDTMPLAARIVSATFNEGYASSLSRAVDSPLSDTAMKAVGATNKQIELLMRLSFENKLETGASSRHLIRVAEARDQSKTDNGLRFVSVGSHYTELFTRVNLALAAEQLGLADKSGDILDRAMFQYDPTNTARVLGKAGMFGRATPAMFAFYQYPAMALETVGREFTNIFSGDPKLQREAGRFFKAQLINLGVLGGTMSWPLVYAVAGVIDQLKDKLDGDDEPTNVRQAYRDFLADMFGKDVAEIIARGVPRAIGADISERIGLQNIAPFTRLLTDRRDWKDAWRDYAREMFGAPAGLGLDILEGMEKMNKGDLSGAMTEMLPTALKNVMKAYKLADDGYRDNKNLKLPLTAGASDIAYQMLGFRPAELAEYQEDKQYRDSNVGVTRREAQNIRLRLATAIEKGDRTDAREWLSEARRFDRANPDYAVLPTIEQTLARRAREQAQAELTNTPLGTRLRSITPGMSGRFANTQ